MLSDAIGSSIMKAFFVLVAVLIYDGVFSLPNGYRYIGSPDFSGTSGIVADLQTNPFLHPDSLQLNQNQFFNGPFISNVNPFYNFSSASDTVPFESYFNPTEFDAQGHYISAETPLIPFTTPIPFFDKVYPSNPVISRQYLPPNTGSRISKSELRCGEAERNILLTTTTTTTTPSTNPPQYVGFAIGGINANIGEFPHMIALGRLDSDQGFILTCGASLISHTWALSAAHCTYGPNGGPTVAALGLHKLSESKSGVTVGIKNLIRHPEYKPPLIYADIALIELSSPIAYNDLIQPACLYQPEDFKPNSFMVTGWGVIEYAGSQQSDTLQKVRLDLIDNPTCRMQLDTSREYPRGILESSMICAGDPSGGYKKDSCQGDSGGPLQVIHPTNKQLYLVVGVTSFGIGCAIENSPGVYTRVSYYLPWIESIVSGRMKLQSFCSSNRS